MTGLAEVLQPQLRRPRPVWIAFAFVMAVIVGWPVYQSYVVRSGAVQVTQAYGPRLSISLERSEWRISEMVRGVVTIKASDAMTLRQDDGLVIDIHRSGVAQTPQNRLATVKVPVPATLADGESLALPFEVTADLAPGTYVLGAAVGAELEKDKMHTNLRAGTVAEFTVR